MNIDKITLKELLRYHEDIVNGARKYLGNTTYDPNLTARKSHERFVDLLKQVVKLVNEK